MNKRRRFKAKRQRALRRICDIANNTDPGRRAGRWMQQRRIWAYGWSWDAFGTRRRPAKMPVKETREQAAITDKKIHGRMV